MPRSEVAIPVSAEIAKQLPTDPEERREVLVLGLREWRVRKVLEAYARGEGSLAFAARQAGVSLREIIPFGYTGEDVFIGGVKASQDFSSKSFVLLKNTRICFWFHEISTPLLPTLA
jgi:hypothetical protein